MPPDGAVSWHLAAPLPQVAAWVETAARSLGLNAELGIDQPLAGALCGWLYLGNASGTPAGRMDVAEARLDATPTGHTRLTILRVDSPIPSRFEKQLTHHELRFKRPLLYAALVAATRRLALQSGVPCSLSP